MRQPHIQVVSKLFVRPVNDGDHKVKALDDDGRLHITSLASTPDIDEMNEIVEPTAFASSIDKFSEIPVMLAYHDMNQPAGLWTEQKVSGAGLMLGGFVSSGRPDIQQLVLDGVLSHTSIGFFVKDVEWDDDLEVLRIKDLELLEVSLVPIPANRSTFVNLNDGLKGWRDEEVSRRKSTPESPVEDGVTAGPPEPDPVPAIDYTPALDAVERAARSLAGIVESAGKLTALD